MKQQHGLIHAFVLDGHGGGRQIGWDEVRSWKPGDGAIWVHLDRTVRTSQKWLQSQAHLDPLVCEALLQEETRPRSLPINEGLLVILRGVNLNPGADPEDMVSIRMWIDAERVISLRRYRVMAADDLRKQLVVGTGPTSPGDFLVRIADRLMDRMGAVIADIEDQADDLEEKVVTAQSHELRSALSDLRRQAIGLRRHIGPQRDVMSRLQSEQVSWLTPSLRAQLREIADRVMRYAEDLDAVREHAAVTHEELTSRLSEQMNKNMYVLSLVAAVFLPLGLLTGLLGINVGGIPGAEYHWSFLIVCVGLGVLATIQIILFRRMRWF